MTDDRADEIAARVFLRMPAGVQLEWRGPATEGKRTGSQNVSTDEAAHILHLLGEGLSGGKVAALTGRTRSTVNNIRVRARDAA